MRKEILNDYASPITLDDEGESEKVSTLFLVSVLVIVVASLYYITNHGAPCINIPYCN